MATPSNRARQAAGLGPQTRAQPSTDVEVSVENRIARTRKMEAAFQDAMPRGVEAKQLIRDAITALRQVPDLAKCDETSFFGALMTAAQLGLRPNVSTVGHGWVLPFRNNRTNKFEAQWILGYQGMIELAWRSGLVASIDAYTIYSNEKWAIKLGAAQTIEHEPILTKADRGDPIIHYCVTKMVNGGVTWSYITEEDAEEAKQFSKTGRLGKGPWVERRGEMSRKTAVRRHWHYMPKSPDMTLALEADEETRLVTIDGDEVDPVTTVERDTEPETGTTEEPETPEVVRTKQAASRNRSALLTQLAQAQGPRADEALAVVLGGEVIDIEFATMEELSEAVNVDLEAIDAAKMDAAAEAGEL